MRDTTLGYLIHKYEKRLCYLIGKQGTHSLCSETICNHLSRNDVGGRKSEERVLGEKRKVPFNWVDLSIRAGPREDKAETHDCFVSRLNKHCVQLWRFSI